MITLHTNHGDIAIELDFDKAPISATNFLQYCRDEFYAGTILIGAVGVTKILYLFSRFYLCKKKEEETEKKQKNKNTSKKTRKTWENSAKKMIFSLLKLCFWSDGHKNGSSGKYS